jgi:hypothetical protein
MKRNYKNKIVGMSVAAAVLLGSSAYAGKIVTDTDLGWEANKQYGFGGWNLDNVEVRMIDVNTEELTGLTFDKTNGTYDQMDYNDTFKSDILQDGTVMGILNGKDWPVGEPAGIKIINGDTKVKHGKPQNCIMTTSYLSAEDNPAGGDGYLTAFDDGNTSTMPAPTLCSSGFQTHKRFKIAMQPASIADVDVNVGGYSQANHIDLVFNLDPDSNTSVQRYQVFSKINNYTHARLNGYKIEVLDENGTSNANLKLSLGEGEGDNGADIWDKFEWANFSHGLWGPYQEVNGEVRFEDGFFDKVRAYLPVTLNEDNNTIEATPGAIAGGNYDDLFGHWLPSKWQPIGIFYDHDDNPLTDAQLMAFWGDPDGDGTNNWHKGNDYNDTDSVEPWELVTQADLDQWNVGAEGSLYSAGLIEDTLNLGLNYIVEVGDQNAIGNTFIIRITPRVSNDQTPPSYVDASGDYILPPEVPADIVPDDGTTDDGTTDDGTTVFSSGGGGGCTYNPDSKHFDMMFLVMMALGLLYPFRRRFIK